MKFEKVCSVRVNKKSMRVNVQKEKNAMTDAPELPPDIAITNVVASTPVVGVGGDFTVDVSVFAPEEDFEDQVGYRLYCYVCSCGGDGPAKIDPPLFQGHVNDEPPIWNSQASTITFKVTAGGTPAIYNFTAVLLEGTKGVPDKEDPPSVFCTECSGSVVVV